MTVRERVRRRPPRYRRAVLVPLLLLAGAGAGGGSAGAGPHHHSPPVVVTAGAGDTGARSTGEVEVAAPQRTNVPDAAAAVASVAIPPPRPVSVRIPAIGVDAELMAVGLEEDGAMEVPDFGTAGWYAEGPRPGAVGPAVVVAHYDSTVGPDVFFGLGSLEPGDEVHVDREDGSVVTFVVDHLEQHPKDELPGGRIWASTDEPRLTLITCGGVFDRATGHYTDNVIAYATGA